MSLWKTKKKKKYIKVFKNYCRKQQNKLSFLKKIKTFNSTYKNAINTSSQNVHKYHQWETAKNKKYSWQNNAMYTGGIQEHKIIKQLKKKNGIMKSAAKTLI